MVILFVIYKKVVYGYDKIFKIIINLIYAKYLLNFVWFDLISRGFPRNFQLMFFFVQSTPGFDYWTISWMSINKVILEITRDVIILFIAKFKLANYIL
jgi:hypothetical protein